ncbi:hypothetical protein PanWU01x14_304630 [Parasponia andersonii]|uniref:Uncharacterized protein n=1 Tax=Parasponia andersonii TaxID=3476 RepID=A0A2P5ASJ3_PARAD|nr:hypothetical protein PanWU01x14_304630 [Parasponia andersonii]
MNFERVIFAIIGFSTSYFLLIPNAQRWHKQQITKEKLGIIKEVLADAEEKVERFQERHDRILSQMCSYYLTHKELEEALAGARDTLKEALEVAATLRKMQFKLINSFPDYDQFYDVFI